MNWYTTVDEFLAMLRLERKSAENTVLAYRNDLSQFCRHLEATLDSEARWSSVTQEHISAYISQIRSGYSSATVARKIAALKTEIDQRKRPADCVAQSAVRPGASWARRREVASANEGDLLCVS